jgi:putative methionine-R-sulfoxide reductase with GAF domain
MFAIGGGILPQLALWGEVKSTCRGLCLLRGIDKIVELARKESAALRELKRTAGIATAYVFPAILAVWVAFYEKLISADPWLFWLPFAGLVLLQAVVGRYHLRGNQLVQEAYFESRDILDHNNTLKKSCNKLKRDIVYLSVVQEAALVWKAMERKYIEGGIHNADDLRESIAEIMAIIVRGRVKLFEFEPDELWNIAVYLYDARQERLAPVWRERHDEHPSKGLGREWARGQGHVGKAFADGATKITGDATDSDVAALMQPPGDMVNAYDDSAYRSFASVPIGPINQGDDPIGILVATSDRINRFDKANSLILLHAASVLANVVHLNHINLSTMLNDRQRDGSSVD